MTIARVQYRQQHILQAADLNAEQDYRLAAQHRHLIGQHSWGIVHGLCLQLRPDGFIVQPGYAIDGFGRELALMRPRLIAWATDTYQLLERSPDIDVWLMYMPGIDENMAASWRTCEASPSTRIYAHVDVLLSAANISADQAKPANPDAYAPPCVPSDLLTPKPHDSLPDELPAWPIYLGRLRHVEKSKDNPDGISLEYAGRRYAGLVAATLISASRIAVAENPAQLAAHDPTPVPSAQLTARQAGERRRVTATLTNTAGVPEPVMTLDTLTGARLHASTRLMSSPHQHADLQLVARDIAVTETDIRDPDALATRIDYLKSLLIKAPDPRAHDTAETPTTDIGQESYTSAAPMQLEHAAIVATSADMLDLAHQNTINGNPHQLVAELNKWITDPRLLNRELLMSLPLRQVTRDLLKAPDMSQQHILARRILLEDLFPDQLATRVALPAAYGIAFQAAPKALKAAAPWRMYRVEIQRHGKKLHQLRIEIGTFGDKEHPERSQFAIGKWSAQDKQFQPCLSIDEACTVHMHAKLRVLGDVIQGTPPTQAGSQGVLEQLAEQWQQGIAEGLAEQATLHVEIRAPNTAKAGSTWPYDVYLNNTGSSTIHYLSLIEQVSVGGTFATRTAATIPSLPGGAEYTHTIIYSDPNLPTLNLGAGTVTIVLTVLGFNPKFNAIYVSKGKTITIIA